MWSLLRHIEEAIELLRIQMYDTADQKGSISQEVITLSQQLDQLLNLYERLKMTEYSLLEK